MTTISWLMLFKEITAVNSKNHTKPINTKCRVTDYHLPQDLKGFCAMLQRSPADAVIRQPAMHIHGSSCFVLPLHNLGGGGAVEGSRKIKCMKTVTFDCAGNL
jgi:hypothetical protein